MNNESKEIKQLSNKVTQLQQEIAKLKRSEAGYKQKVDALQKSEEYFRAIMQNSSDIIIVVDKKGTITYVNNSIERLLGYKPEELIGKSGFDFIMLADLPRAVYDFGRAILTKDILIPNAFRVRHKDGSEHVLEGIGNNLLNNPAVAGFVMNARDITDRRKAEEELGIYRKRLEDLVEERTSELAKINSRLLIELGERQRMGEAIRKSEERYRLLADNAQDIIWIVGMDMRLIYISPSVLRTLGFSVEEAMARTMIEVFTPASFEMAMQVFTEEIAIESSGQSDPNRSKILEVEMFHKDGFTVPFEVHYSFFRGSDGIATGILAIARNITERKQAEGKLYKTTQRYQTILSQLYVGALVVSEDNHIEYANQTFCDLFGLKDLPSELIGLAVDELIKEMLPAYADPAEILDRVRKIVAQRQRVVGKEVLMSDGRILLVDFVPIIVDGQQSGRMWQHRDITERRRIELALRKAEREKAAILDAMSELVIYLDTNMKIIWSNSGMNRLFNMKSNQVEGRYCYEVLHKLNRPCRICPAIKSIKTGKPCIIEEFSSLGKTWTLRSYPVWNGEGNLVGVVEIVADITDRKRKEEERKVLEERLQRSEKMEALGALAGGVAHDLNNVLGILVGYSELILNKIDESSAIKPHVINIMKGGEKAAAIVQDLLTLARRGVHVEKIVNLNATISDFQKSPEFEKLCSFHPDVQIKAELNTDLLNITGSPVHLATTFFNLVSNAVEAMPNGGLLTITTSNQYLDRPIQGYDDVREGDYVVLSISDTGEGIPAADLKRIFEPFYTKKVMGRSGTGLGLAVVWGTVKDHSGYINVQSEEGKGTTFTLYFPVTREEVSKGQISIPVSEYMGDGESILVVDDVEGQRELATHMLQELNYNAATVSSGEDAIEYIKTQKADLIVLDMIMDPGIDGLDTYRGILKINPKQKAIIVSGFSETVRVNQAQALGAGAYIKKPYVMERLGLAVRKELDKP